MKLKLPPLKRVSKINQSLAKPTKIKREKTNQEILGMKQENIITDPETIKNTTKEHYR